MMSSPAAAIVIEWRRPLILDITPPKRPTAEQADARHREVGKHHRKQRKRRSEENPEKPEDVRLAHLRWSELQRLMRVRYGVEWPNTDAARRDLQVMVNYAVLTGRKVKHLVELLAPWLPEDEADDMARQRPILHRADDLARKIDLHYLDRQALAIHTIGAVDCDQDERERLRREKCNDAKRRKRAAAKQETNTMQTHTAKNLPSKAQKVLARIDGTEIAVPELIKRVASLKEFQKLASPRQEVHRVLDHLVAAGLITDRYAPGRTRPVRYVASATVARRA
jgi:hypothetical protein